MPAANGAQNNEPESLEQLLRRDFCLLEFWTDWCPYSLLVKRKTEKLAQLYGGRIAVSRINAESGRRITDGLQVRYIPATLFLQGGKVVERWYGDTPVQLISMVVDEYLQHS
jgi:thioredoxin-like negative regulator of GroEL